MSEVYFAFRAGRIIVKRLCNNRRTNVDFSLLWLRSTCILRIRTRQRQRPARDWQLAWRKRIDRGPILRGRVARTWEKRCFFFGCVSWDARWALLLPWHRTPAWRSRSCVRRVPTFGEARPALLNALQTRELERASGEFVQRLLKEATIAQW